MGSTILELADLSESLGMIVGVHGRRSPDGSFSKAETMRLLRIARVLDLAQKVLGDRHRGLQWLQHPNSALRFQTPLSQLETGLGNKQVVALLHRIDAGKLRGA